MGRNRGRQAKKEGGQAGEHQQRQNNEYQQPSDPPRAVLALHPGGAALAVAVGPELRVYDTRAQKLHVLVCKPDAGQQQQQGKGQQAAAAAPIVRGLAFDASGRYLLAGSEDKAAGLRLWDCDTWQLVQSIKVPKKVTTCAFTADGRHMLAADKFGDVLAATTQRPEGLPEGQAQEPEVLLGHYCAILTSLSLSANGRLLATTDRDHRVRVSIVPTNPMAGAHDIQAFCFGHTTFVTCSAFVHQGDQELLVSGGGDGTLRLWDPLTGELLHTLELPPLPQPSGGEQDGDKQAAGEQAADLTAAEQQGATQEEQEEEDGGASSDEAGAACAGGAGDAQAAAADAAVPLALAASPDGGWLVAAVDGRDELCLVQLDWQARQLREAAWCGLPGLHLPACLAFEAGGLLWAVGGPVADDSAAAFLACATVEAASGAARLAPAALPAWLPAEGAVALQALAGDEAAALAAAAERRRLASQLLRKKNYDPVEREARKRRRRDRMAAGGSDAAVQDA
ncbi:tRNA (guanine-N(7)-)-methyltransferase non-catalytic subunit wdr4 [Chlorella sorokiniana]|uniref:tRNA (guanine-N(7)-)-methyltransferase non-catalytic subunit n=1 Tax=Chlorella sorokiniana TaxID=3076 RepID=A0A2P6U5R2_CHLSO|nr:tRNA (guanine-N(7)-)-methyltransferase non-catalytic subunit wdr4 [Chlorella sorokiniana]|eukprot:PRW61612.1 tRNA (guanine-N(7)-)-methyltransferase non-catalytic subunit wdr4 [Chlorella sorokiniana]